MHQQKWNYYPFWQEILTRLESSLPEQECITWIHRISYIESENHKLVLAVPSLFIRDYIKTQYLPSIISLLQELTGERIEIELIVKQQEGNLTPSKGDKITQRSESKDSFSKAPMPKAQKKPKDPNINNGYQFGSFVVGENSSFAYNVSMAIAKNPGVSYNPCLIYGGVGLGKTHLIQSIGNFIQDNTPELQVLYVTAEMFTNEFIGAIGDKKLHNLEINIERLMFYL